MKKCTKCKIEKPVSKFAPRKSRKDPYQSWCHQCTRDKQIQTQYGLPAGLFGAMVIAQGGYCAICDQVMNPPVIDHDHACCPERKKSCGKCIRFLLCNNCNVLLGMAKDDPKLLRKAADYLERS